MSVLTTKSPKGLEIEVQFHVDPDSFLVINMTHGELSQKVFVPPEKVQKCKFNLIDELVKDNAQKFDEGQANVTKFNQGDYVLATKWSDGDPMDQYCIGFYDQPYKDRHLVVNKDGEQFRGNGFRRVEKISAEEGRRLLAIFPELELNQTENPMTLWEHLQKIRQEINILANRWHHQKL